MSQSAEGAVGAVVSLWRYPVKSMMGEELNATEVAERGAARRSGLRRGGRRGRQGRQREEPAASGRRLFEFRAALSSRRATARPFRRSGSRCPTATW